MYRGEILVELKVAISTLAGSRNEHLIPNAVGSCSGIDSLFHVPSSPLGPVPQ